MGALGTLAIGLIFLCFTKAKTKKEIKNRLIVFIIGMIASLIASIIFVTTGDTAEDKEGGWVAILLYVLFFGWRMVLDAVRYSKAEDIPQEEEEEPDESEDGEEYDESEEE